MTSKSTPQLYLCITLLNTDIHFTKDIFGEVNVTKIVNENFVYKCNASLHVTHYQCSKIKLTVKPIVAHGLKADRLSSVRWKGIPDAHCTDRVTLATYRCIEEDNFDFGLQALPDLLVAF